jgi:hypothetical protein
MKISMLVSCLKVVSGFINEKKANRKQAFEQKSFNVSFDNEFYESFK